MSFWVFTTIIPISILQPSYNLSHQRSMPKQKFAEIMIVTIMLLIDNHLTAVFLSNIIIMTIFDTATSLISRIITLTTIILTSIIVTNNTLATTSKTTLFHTICIIIIINIIIIIIIIIIIFFFSTSSSAFSQSLSLHVFQSCTTIPLSLFLNCV